MDWKNNLQLYNPYKNILFVLPSGIFRLFHISFCIFYSMVPFFQTRKWVPEVRRKICDTTVRLSPKSDLKWAARFDLQKQLKASSGFEQKISFSQPST